MSNKVRTIWACILICIIIGGFGYMMRATYTVPRTYINGDTLGRDGSESIPEYLQRADTALEEAPENTELWALVTFTGILSPEQAAELLAPATRVGSIVADIGAPIAVPEPIAGYTRADVFRDHLDRMNASGLGLRGMTGAVVYTEKDNLEQIKNQAEVLSVEPAPEGASRSRIGVHTVLDMRIASYM